MRYHDGWHDGPGGGAWLAMALVVLAAAVVVSVALVYALRAGRPPAVAPDRQGQDPALRILDERYARGEITTEEYRERRTVLRPE